MVTSEQALADLLDHGDGATRDVEFTPVARQPLFSFLRLLSNDQDFLSASDIEGNDIVSLVRDQRFDEAFQGNQGHVLAELSSTASIIRFLKLFVFWEHEDPNYRVEVSFFPADVVVERFTLNAFLTLLQGWNDRLQADDYFVHYENAGWKLYDSDDPCVIFTLKRPPRSAV